MRLYLFVVMIRTRDRREGRSKLKGEPLETRNERKRESVKKIEYNTRNAISLGENCYICRLEVYNGI